MSTSLKVVSIAAACPAHPSIAARSSGAVSSSGRALHARHHPGRMLGAAGRGRPPSTGAGAGDRTVACGRRARLPSVTLTVACPMPLTRQTRSMPATRAASLRGGRRRCRRSAVPALTVPVRRLQTLGRRRRRALVSVGSALAGASPFLAGAPPAAGLQTI